MIVLVDIGNSRSKFTQVIDDVICNALVLDNHQPDEDKISNYISEATQVLISSVKNTIINETLIKSAKTLGIKHLSIETPKTAFGLTTAYEHPNMMGVDRWLALVGASTLFPKQNVLVIDSGTATTIDVLTKSGQHMGGWILPGVELMHDSLLTKTDKVRTETTNTQVSVSFGKNTTECVNNACWAVLAGAINYALQNCTRDNMDIDKIVITGGNAASVKPLLDIDVHLVKDLIFYGMLQYRD